MLGNLPQSLLDETAEQGIERSISPLESQEYIELVLVDLKVATLLEIQDLGTYRGDESLCEPSRDERNPQINAEKVNSQNREPWP